LLNINGFATQLLQAELKIIHQFKHRLRVGIIMLQATNINWRNPKIKELFHLTDKKANNNISVTQNAATQPINMCMAARRHSNFLMWIRSKLMNE
jgi:hypothetical protein